MPFGSCSSASFSHAGTSRTINVPKPLIVAGFSALCRRCGQQGKFLAAKVKKLFLAFGDLCRLLSFKAHLTQCRGDFPYNGCHTFRATGITAYLLGGGSVESAQQIAKYKSPRTTAKRASFEMFRRNLHNPEILTFDELLARAEFIVNTEGDTDKNPR